jgi:hypothetical protein
MHKTFRLLATSTLLLGVLGIAASFAQQGGASAQLPIQSTLQLARFNSIAVIDGGHVVLRPAPTQRVTLLRGSLDYTRLSTTDGGRLVIDKCIRKCPRGYQLEVEIFAPSFGRISLANGGRVQSRGDFPRQGELALAVSNGGTIDVRSMVAERVTASVNQGGGILTVPRALLFARVTNGGMITYWGDARVRSSVGHGGAVNKGSPSQIDVPLSEVGFSHPSATKHR